MNKRITTLTAALATSAALLLSGCSSNIGTSIGPMSRSVSTQSGAALAAAKGVMILGEFTILNSTSGYPTYTATSGGCVGTNGYNDLTPGATATVTTGNGDIIGQGYLDHGTVNGDGCLFMFAIQDLPAGKEPYMVEVTHRGKLMATPIVPGGDNYTFIGTIGGN